MNGIARLQASHPRPVPPLGAPTGPQVPRDSDTSPRRLLIVEDDSAVAALIAGIAQGLGFETLEAAAFGPIQRSIQGLEGMVVLDLNLPDVDGVEILRHLADAGFAFPLILISGMGERVIRAAEKIATERGLWVLGTLAKPFLPEELRHLLRSSRNRPRAKKSTSPNSPRFSEDQILEALQAGRLEVHYQPKLDISSREVAGLEALARLRIFDGGALLPPKLFIGFAEREGLIEGLTARVCARALSDCRSWRAAGLRAGVSVNFSVQSLHGLNLPDIISGMAHGHGVAPENFVVEITESSLAREPVRALDILTRLRLKGFGLSIDDFGTGYSTMQQLERIPFCELKLDRGFVRGAASNTGALAIMKSSIELAHDLEMKVVAEGVESREDWDLVSSLGCDEAQGFLIARPMALDELMAWLEARENLPASRT